MTSTADECKGLWRYSRSDGTREYVIWKDDNDVDADGDTNTFVNQTTQTASADGFIRFGQWKDTVAIPSDAATLKWYNSGDATDIRTANLLAADSTGEVGVTGDQTGGAVPVIKAGFYSYIYTYEYEMDGDRLSESLPVEDSGNPGIYWYDAGVVTTEGTHWVLLKNATARASLPTHVARINIYRTPDGDSFDYSVPPTSSSKKTNMWLLLSVERSDWPASANQTVLEDRGQIELDFGRQLTFNKQDVPPNAKMVFSHKNRFIYMVGSALWFSDLNEPESVQADSEIFLQKAEGENLTAAFSWGGKFMVAMEDNASYIIGGGDFQLNKAAQPDYYVEPLKAGVGCIAIESLAITDGLACWLANDSVVFFDGSSVRDLQTEEIREYLREIPAARREFAAGGFNVKERQYWLAITPSGGTENTRVLVFDFRIGAWFPEAIYTNGAITLGFNVFSQVRGGDEVPQMIAATNLTGASQTTVGAIVKFGGVDYDITDDTSGDIDWNFETADYVLGAPELVKDLNGVTHVFDSDSNITARVIPDDTDGSAEDLTLSSGSQQQTVFNGITKNMDAYRYRVKYSATTRSSRCTVKPGTTFWYQERDRPDVSP